MEKSLHSSANRRLCALLRDIRRDAGLRQVDVAARLDVPQSFVSKYESGERRLDVIELMSVLNALGTSLPAVVEDIVAITTPPARS
jgi:transcriptional regulator with XRE-family HTH domain